MNSLVILWIDLIQQLLTVLNRMAVFIVRIPEKKCSEYFRVSEQPNKNISNWYPLAPPLAPGLSTQEALCKVFLL